MSKHTPGPWTIEKTTEGYGVRAPHWGYVAIHHSSGLPHWEEGQAANRLLIAAAPDMLAVLQQMVEQICHPANADHTLDAFKRGARIAEARAAIAKATGVE